MKLWILRPVENLPKNDNPWEPWYDKCFGIVVRAKTEKIARTLAANQKYSEFPAWLDKKYSTCKELKSTGKECIIIEDIHAA